MQKKMHNKEYHDTPVISSGRPNYANGRIGVISSYNKYRNVATVMIVKDETDEIDEVLPNVPCPTLLGIQTVNPEPGMLCYVLFKSNNVQNAVITEFYSMKYESRYHFKQTYSPNMIPNYLYR